MTKMRPKLSTLLSRVLAMCLASLATSVARPDFNQEMEAGDRRSSTSERPIPSRLVSSTVHLSQAETRSIPAAPDTASPVIPEDALKAEIERRWDDVERLYRDLLAKAPKRVDLLLRLVDVLAVQNKRVEAAETLAQAADLKPQDADLQLHASEALGAADRPTDALRYTVHALAMRPTDQALHRRRGRTDSANHFAISSTLSAGGRSKTNVKPPLAA